MEQLTAFLSSDPGRFLCYAFLFVGTTDILIGRIFIGGIRKKAEQKILPGMSPEQKKPIEEQISRIKLVINVMTFGGLAFIAFATFGLTR